MTQAFALFRERVCVTLCHRPHFLLAGGPPDRPFRVEADRSHVVCATLGKRPVSALVRARLAFTTAFVYDSSPKNAPEGAEPWR